jgi:hypothetical protein
LVKLALFLFANFSDGQRIGTLMRPVHYDLALLPINSGGSPRLCGHVFIDLEPTTTTNLVTLHGVDITVLDVSVEQVLLVTGNESVASNSSNKDRFLQLEDLCFSGLFEQVKEAHTVIQKESERQQIDIILKEILIKDKRYRLGLFYVAKVREDARGFFRTNYRNDNTSCCIQGYVYKSLFLPFLFSCCVSLLLTSNSFYSSWFGGTQMEASSARKVLPCFDEPGFKTTFEINIAHDKTMAAISNMPETGTHPM